MTVSSIVIPVKDIATATAFYRTVFGAEPHTETPYYVGFNLDGLEIGLNPNGHATGMVGPTAYHAHRRRRGGRRRRWSTPAAPWSPRPPRSGARTVVAIVADADGNHVGLIA